MTLKYFDNIIITTTERDCEQIQYITLPNANKCSSKF